MPASLIYLGIMLMGYALTVADYPGVLGVVGGIALTGGLPEAVVAGVVTAPVATALKKIYK